MSGRPSAALLKKHHGDMAAAWKEYRGGASSSGGSHKKTRRAPSSGGSASRPGGGDLRTTVRSRLVSEVDPSELGAIIYGMLAELESPVTLETADVIPSVMGRTQQSAQQALVSDEKAAWLARFREEIIIGREMVRTGAFGKVLMTMGINPQKGAAHYASAVRRATASIGGSVGPVGGAGFTPPFDAATVVTSPFGAQRAGALHRGVDLAAPVGTPVHAPWPAKVDAAFTEDAGGNVVRLALQRPDGGYANETTTSDDSGLLLSFVHLQRFTVKPGDVVNAGDVVGYSGDTGQDSNGPHLHIMAEYFNDAPAWGLDSNSRVFVDPAALYGGVDALASGAAPVPFQENQVMGAIVAPRDGGGSSNPLAGIMSAVSGGGGGEQPTVLRIDNHGALVIGGGTAVNTNAKVVLPLSFAGGGQGDGGYGNAPLPDALRGASPGLQGLAGNVMGAGGSILQGIGNLAGQVFGRLVSSDGIQKVLHLGGVAAQGLGGLAGVAGPLATFAAPFLTSIPYVGAFLGPAASVLGPIMGVAGPVVAGLGGVVNQAAGIPGLADGASSALQNIPNVLGGMFGAQPQNGNQALNVGVALGNPFAALGLT